MMSRWLEVAGVQVHMRYREPCVGELLDGLYGDFLRTGVPDGDALEMELVPGTGHALVTSKDILDGGSVLQGQGSVGWVAGDHRLAWVRGLLQPPMVHAVVRMLLARELLARGALLLHACAVEMGGRALVFAGPSGSGKSTIGRTLGGRVLSDEAVAFHCSPEGEPMASGTPFWGGTPMAFPVGAVVCIGHGPVRRFARLNHARLAARLAAFSGPLGEEDGARALSVAATLASTVRGAEATLSSVDDVRGWLLPQLDAVGGPTA